jgi:hypothetical protein
MGQLKRMHNSEFGAKKDESSMNYGLKRLVFGSSACEVITADEYQEIRAADVALVGALALEEKFDQVIENFAELESALLISTLRDMLFRDSDFLWFQQEKNIINRKLINLLNSCRGYLDFVKPYGAKVLAGDSTADEFHDSFARHYDATLGYRVMETLRNYGQHHGFPIHVLEFNSRLNEDELRNRFSFGISVYVKTSQLRQDKIVKPKVMSELEIIGDRIDLKPLFRDYVGALGQIHDQIRSAQKVKVAIWDKVFLDSRQRFSLSFPDEQSAVGLAATRITNRGEHSDEIYLATGRTERRAYLESKNGSFGNFAKRYVSGQVSHSVGS